MKARKHKHSRIIDQAGGTVEVAELMDVSPAAVSHWRKRGMPNYRFRMLRLLRPEIFEVKG